MYNDPETTHQGKRIIFAGTWLDFAIALIEASTHLHERLGTEELDVKDTIRLVNECRHRPDPTAVVDFTDEIAALEAVQADLGTRFTISGGEVMELGTQEANDTDIPF